MASISYITAMLADPLVRTVLLTVCFTLMGVAFLWAVWTVIDWCRTFVHQVHVLQSDVNRFNKYIHEDIGRKLAANLYGTRDAHPPTPSMFVRPSSPPALPTMDATDWVDDDDRPSAQTHLKGA